MMRTTRATAVALAGAAIGMPAAAEARSDGPPSRVLLRAPLDHQQSLVAHRRATHANSLRTRAIDLKRALDRAQGRKVHLEAERRRSRRAATPVLEHHVKKLETKLAAARTPDPAATTTTTAAPSSAASPTLEAIAACESGGNPTANTGNGFYGKYQFTQQTWESVGGTGNPAAAPEAEQDARAAQLYAQQGSAPWPVCGR